MTTLSEHLREVLTPRPKRQIVDQDSSRFAAAWLHDFRRSAVRSAPVIAVVRELAATLRDEQIPAAQALFALRRAADLLVVFASASREGQVSRSRLDSEDRMEADRYLGQEATSRPGNRRGSLRRGCSAAQPR